MKLSELKTNERGIIVKVAGHGSFRKRITEMGFIKGKEVKVILNAPLRDPIEYEIIGYRISLRRDEAQKIEVLSETEVEQSLLTPTEQAKPLISENSEHSPLDQRMKELAKERGNTIRVALVGNPNCGKTSLFNIASGSHEHVGNYSGVTVDAKEGRFEYKGYKFILIDLPGTYSLSAYSPEELFVREHLIKELPDVVVNVVDATNLERNLYLSSQLIDMDLRVVMALNMFDEFSQKKDKLDIKMLGTLLGMPIVPTVSKTGKGINELFDSIIDIYENIHTKRARHIHIHHGVEVEKSIEKVQHLIRQNEGIRQKYSTRYLAIKYLENDKEIAKEVELFENRDEIIAARYQEDKRIERLIGSNLESAIVDAKYAFIQGALKETYKPSSETPKKTLTDRIDSIITNKWLAFPIFILILYVMFEATFKLGEYPMMWIEWLVKKFALFISTTMPEGLFKDLIVDGIIGGVGSVLVFLPNILILYMFISLLEDSGYMARAAFIMDKLMHRMGLHGKSFIPMIMGFGCNVPAIMATRMIENRKSRLVTILIIPLMSCAGRLPIYILLAGAFFPSYGSLVMLGIYGLGILLAIFSAKVISRFMKEDDLPFVMELPPYRVPTSKSIFRHTWEKGKQYLQKMGGIILVASLIIWSLGYFPRQQEGQTTAQQQEQSYIGTIGKAIEPALEPLGFDWKMGVGILSGIAAKELVVSTMGVLYNIDQEQLDSGSGETMLQKALQQASTPAAALAFMVFVLLYFPCIATFIAIKQEGGGWKWAIFSAIYTIILAWVAAFAVYQIGSIFL
ncbi:MAG: ferrous iron transport protein B [Bacteroidales bacterium]|nr:ferrous iron transport protein B [Bacteroidales bacterium]